MADWQHLPTDWGKKTRLLIGCCSVLHDQSGVDFVANRKPCGNLNFSLVFCFSVERLTGGDVPRVVVEIDAAVLVGVDVVDVEASGPALAAAADAGVRVGRSRRLVGVRFSDAYLKKKRKKERK